MGKIFLIGDTHLGMGYPNKVDKWFKIHKDYFKDFLIPLLKSRFKEGDIIIHLGDLFDNRNVIPINILNYGLDIVEEISKIGPLHIIVGNHDLWSKSSSEINTIRPFKWIPGVTIHDKVGTIDFFGEKLLIMPYMNTSREQIEVINSNSADHLFCHSDLNGCKMHLTSVAHRNSDKIDVESFSNFKSVWSGHIHIKQNHKNFNFAGSIFQMDRNDTGDRKGIYILDPSDSGYEFIENTLSPEFIKLNLSNMEDLERISGMRDSKDFLDIRISNTFLLSSRKVRRLIENLLSEIKFETIEYLDDIRESGGDNKASDSELTESIKNDLKSGNFTINLDYEEFILNWIKSQQWESDGVKNGVISELMEIIRIWKKVD